MSPTINGRGSQFGTMKLLNLPGVQGLNCVSLGLILALYSYLNMKYIKYILSNIFINQNLMIICVEDNLAMIKASYKLL